ncbi:MAG: phosphotransferase family protein [Chloroflexi bacterium]|nr:phosphotransferase family protein [Chloroflexota bacterium]
MNTSLIDQPRDVRTGEELPGDKLSNYLTANAQLPNLSGEVVIKQFPSGHSNLTYAIQIGEMEFVLRRPPFGANIKTAHDMSREFKILSHLYPVYDKVPRAVLYCDDESIIGSPFYVMERVNGIVLRAKLPKGMELTPDILRNLSLAFVHNLTVIHAIDYEAAGLGDLGKPSGYVARQVRGWTERYVNAKTDDVPDIERTATWLADAKRLPGESGAALIHNDYKYDNLVLDANDLHIRAVLDWEMATIGDPLMDLGTSLGYWVEANDPEELRALAFGLTMLEGNLTREGIVQRYALVSGRDVSQFKFYYVFGIFKIAVIVQQIYNRYKKGFSHDPRFATMIDAVRILGKTAVREIEK